MLLSLIFALTSLFDGLTKGFSAAALPILGVYPPSCTALAVVAYPTKARRRSKGTACRAEISSLEMVLTAYAWLTPLVSDARIFPLAATRRRVSEK